MWEHVPPILCGCELLALLIVALFRMLAAPFVRMAQARKSLGQAIDDGDTAEIRRLLDAGTGIDTRGTTGRTVLMVAAGAGDLALVKEALWRGADPDARDLEGNTALSLAQEGGHEIVVCALKGVPPPEELPGEVETLPIPGHACPTYADLPVPVDEPTPME